MAQYTRRAIMQSYLRLVRQKPLDKLTVKDIVEDCEITRNTFYYHFQDIYDLTAEVFHSEFAALLRSGGTDIGWWDTVRKIADFAQKNRAAVLHVFRSARRDELLRVFDVSSQGYIVELLRKLPQAAGVSEEDLQVLARALRCAVTGFAQEWLNKGMKEDPGPTLDRMERLFHDLVEQALRNAAPPQT